MAQTNANVTVSIDPARADALDRASKMVAEWTDQVKNPRGYVHDKWQPIDIEARTSAVLRLAEFLMTKPSLLRPPLPPLTTTVLGWPIDGRDGPPPEQLYRFAKDRLRIIGTDGLCHEQKEIQAFETVIQAWQDANNLPLKAPPEA